MAANDAQVLLHAAVTHVPAVSKKDENVCCLTGGVDDLDEVQGNQSLLSNEAKEEPGTDVGFIVLELIYGLLISLVR